jgi:uncharacterized protein (TIGR00730 family)
MQTVCVFCGSEKGNNPLYAQEARRLGQMLARTGLKLVFGGGHIGLMGVLADAVLEAGGQVIGVIPQALADKELAHQGLTELHVVDTMHQRKALMADLSQAFVALPGGYGTLDETFEILTWAQLGIHTKPIGLLNTAGFFDPLLAWIDRAVADRFLRAEHRKLLNVATDPDKLLDALRRHEPAPQMPKWIEAEDR